MIECPNCHLSTWPQRMQDGIYVCHHCNRQYRVTYISASGTGNSAMSILPAAAPACPTCEATQAEMAELRAKFAAKCDDLSERLKHMGGIDLNNEDVEEWVNEFRALLAQPGTQREEEEDGYDSI